VCCPLTLVCVLCNRPQYNPDAAPSEERDELLKAGPWCFATMSGDKVVECDGRAQRTQRAGVYEMARWSRPDRVYCGNLFFRTRVVPELPEFENEETCRAAIDFRNLTCYTECGALSTPSTLRICSTVPLTCSLALIRRHMQSP
jgi:hypothetical protein